jgi:hypothetical protein
MLLRFNLSRFRTIRSLRPRSHLLSVYLQLDIAGAARRHYLLTPERSARDICNLAAMAPKQATLGYVKPSQTTLGCGDTLVQRRHCFHNADNLGTGSSSGNQTAPQQSSNRSSPFRRSRRVRAKMQSQRQSQVHPPRIITKLSRSRPRRR